MDLVFIIKNMISLLVSFFTSFMVTTLIIRTQKLHDSVSGDSHLIGPQKFHYHSVPRVGGIAIGLALFASIAVSHNQGNESQLKILLLYCAIPTFSIGLLEDVTKKISIRTRLLFTAASAALACLLAGVKIISLNIPIIDTTFLIPAFSILFTVFAISGLTNAYNIIDGFNGLSSMTGIITLLAIGYMGLKFNDPIIYSSSFTMAGAIMGFFLFNYPKGLIFLGDGGAYLIGFWIASISVLLVNRHPQISPWFALMVNAYPILETLFTIYRRKFHQGKSPGHPDGIHLHSLIFRRVLNRFGIKSELDWLNANSKTSPYLWVLSSLATIPAIIYWNSTPTLMVFFILFSAIYIWIYKRIVAFKTPKWLRI